MIKPHYIQTQMCNTDNLFEGETIEQKVRKLVSEKQPIEGASPQIFTEKKDGVQPQYDIRTDRWEVAQAAMDAVAKAQIAKGEQAVLTNEEKVPKGESEPSESLHDEPARPQGDK